MTAADNKIALFEQKEIRRIWHKGEWYFSIVDVVGALTESKNPRSYWGKMKERDAQLLTFWEQLKLPSRDGKKYKTECANTEGILRIIQSIPSPKAEPFKRWLAQVGKERIDETENPDLILDRARREYLNKGYPTDWIELRIRGLIEREHLTHEWAIRNVKQGREYGILTAVVSKATFGLTPTEHRKLKKLKRENLRDHMTHLELIFNTLGEVAATEITRAMDAQGFKECEVAAEEGGKIAGDARKQLEAKTGNKVVTADKYLPSGKQSPRQLQDRS
jgi:DNA-damage-inducible protein D